MTAFTLAQPIQCSGVGLHSGVSTQVKICPALRGEGRYFVRTDLPNQPKIPATLDSVGETTLSTQLRQENASIRTVEHLLASLTGLNIPDARIEIDGAEVPLLDGSAQVWIETIQPVTVPLAQEGTAPWQVSEPITIYAGDAFVSAIPAPTTRFSYGVDYPYEPIGSQWHSWDPAQDSFLETIAPARTFGFADQIEQLRQAGLIQGGSLDNALVCDRKKWLNPPLRFANEPVRHKLLDLVGDLSLLETIPQAHFLAYKASHQLHIRLAQALAQSRS